MSDHTGHRKRLRDRAEETGLDGFQPHEVLELLLMETIPRRDVNPLAHALIERFGSFAGVLDAKREELMQVDGVGERTAEHLSRQPDYLSYYMKDRWERSGVPLLTPAQTCAYCTSMFGRQREESLGIVCLDVHRRVILHKILVQGTIDEAPVYPRMMAEAALRFHAHSVILVHNHPSGVLRPSRGDLQITEQVSNALSTLEIELLDHIIVAGPRAISLIQEGYILRGEEKDARRMPIRLVKREPLNAAADPSEDRLF